MSDLTTRLRLPFPDGSDGPDGPDVPYWMERLAADLDLKVLGYDQGTLAARPAAGTQGRQYYATDAAAIFYDTGNDWVPYAWQPGDIRLSARLVSTPGWLECNGEPHTRGRYPALYAAIAGLYGTATGDSFNLPDMRDRLPVGYSATKGLGRPYGAETHSHTVPSHKHSVGPHSHGHTLSVAGHYHGIGADGAHGHSIAGSNLGTRGYQSGTLQGAYLQNVSPATAPIDWVGHHSHGGATGWSGAGVDGAISAAAQFDSGSSGGATVSASNLPPTIALAYYIKT